MLKASLHLRGEETPELYIDFIILIPPFMKPGCPLDATLSLLLALTGSVILAVVRARQARAATSEDYV